MTKDTYLPIAIRAQPVYQTITLTTAILEVNIKASTKPHPHPARNAEALL